MDEVKVERGITL
jgi:hypothetical protein